MRGVTVRSCWFRICVAFICCAAGAFSVIAAAAPTCEGKLVVPRSEAPTRRPKLVLAWTGTIAEPMAECIQAEFDKVRGAVSWVVLSLDSEGGYLPATDRVIATLRKIRETHHLDTMVAHGGKCWSACVPVFLTGKRRIAALASTWLFHEVGVWATEGGNRYRTVDRAASDRIFQDYFVWAGVSEAWLKRLYIVIPHSDYWQTGQNLWDDKSGIITHPLDNLVPRNTERPKY
jgi:hypothetical protein